MIRCADCEHFRYFNGETKIGGVSLSGPFCLGKSLISNEIPMLDEKLAYKYSRSFMCDLYLPIKGKELGLFKKEE